MKMNSLMNVCNNKFHYYYPCDVWCLSGYYCVNGTVTPVICPIGYYCPVGTTFDQEYPCPPGTFNNITGQLAVSLCFTRLCVIS